MAVRGGGIEQVDAAHHLRDALGRVVDHDGEVVGREAVAPADHVVARALR